MKDTAQRSPKLRRFSQIDPVGNANGDKPHADKGHASEFTGNAQLAHLEAMLKEWRNGQPRDQEEAASQAFDPPKTDVASRPWLAPIANVRLSTFVKSAVAIAVALILGWMPATRLFATTSAEAVVNARVVTLRAPIEGDVTMISGATDIGSNFQTNEQILTIRNPRADYAHLDSLRRERDQLGTSIAALEAKKDLLAEKISELATQQESFRNGRIAQLEQRIRESDADIAVARAQHDNAAAALTRAASLRKTDAVSQAFLDKALQDERVSKNTIQSITERRKGTLVELDAAKRGIYIGDSYNDTPQSAQRKMEAELELADARARLAGSKAELTVLEARIDTEARRNEELSAASIRSTVNGRVWEILTAPGEHVNAGQDLVRMLDCGSAMVTASVSESAYQKLRIGQAATFRPRDGGEVLSGRIVGLNGLAAVASNSAIQQSLLAREPYHVTLNFPGLAEGGDCRVGRSGLVKFDTSSASAAD